MCSLFRGLSPEQKRAFLNLAKRYDERVWRILSRGAADEVVIASDADAACLESFADGIVDKVVRDLPDAYGADADLHADAEMAAHRFADLVAAYGRRR